MCEIWYNNLLKYVKRSIFVHGKETYNARLGSDKGFAYQ